MQAKKILSKTIESLKNQTIKSAEIDARILLEFVTGKSREFLLAHPEFELSDAESKQLIKLIERREKNEPTSYLTGHKEFYGLDFFVTKDVLIPRPETELLVEQALEFIKSKVHTSRLGLSETDKVKSTLKILDVGTGSGNIIISIAKCLDNKSFRFDAIDSNLNFIASDISKKALVIAKKNAKKHQVKIKFIQSDIFENIEGKFDLIVANLPYVPTGGSSDEEIKHEPQNSIFADDNGTKIIKKFLHDAKDHISSNGLILIEVDPRNADEIREYLLLLYNSGEVIYDLSKKKRLIKILT